MKININALAAEHNFAQAIEGFGVEPGGTVVLTLDDAEFKFRYNPRADFVELRFDGAAPVTIERPVRDGADADAPIRHATVRWSSSSSRANGYGDAVRTATVLKFAAGVAAMLTLWATTDQLARLRRADGPTTAPAQARTASEPFPPGSLVDVEIVAPGGSRGRVVGSLRGRVLNAGIEYDVALLGVPAFDRAVLADADVNAADLPTVDGAWVLCNCQPESLTAVAS